MPDLSPLAEAGLVGVAIAALILVGVQNHLTTRAMEKTADALQNNTVAMNLLATWIKETLPALIQSWRQNK